MIFGPLRLWLGLFVLGLAQLGDAGELPKNFPQHPRLLFGHGDLAEIRARAAGPCRNYFESLKHRADDWVARQTKLPDRGGQWFHWYSCPKHGARLRTESPTRHVCPVGHEVSTGYPYDDVVIGSEHNRLADAIRTLGIVYQVTADSHYGAKAKEILLAYAEKYQSYPLHDIRGQAKVGGGKVGPQTLDEATWLITVVEGTDCIWDTLTSEEQQKVKDGLLLPATGVIRQHKMGIHNIQCWKNSAVGLTGLLLGDLGLVEEAIHGESGYDQQMAKGVSADGPWFEGAWGYHFYTLNAVLHLTEGAYHSGIDLYGPALKRMLDAPLAMAMPDLSLPAFNDSQRVDLTGSVGLYETAFVHYRDARYQVLIARDRHGTEASLLHGASNGGPAPLFEPVSRNFAVSGNAVLAAGSGTNATWLCMKYGPHGGGHGHPDKLNFVLFGLGQVIAPDPGTANYGVPIQAGWFRTTLAHNTLVVDQQSQQPAQGTCTAFIATNGFSAVMADAGKIYDGVRFHRTIALVGEKLILFVDQVKSDAPHLYDLAYHNDGLFVEPQGSRFEVPDKPGYSYLRDTRATVSSALLQLKFDLGGENPVWWAMAGGEESTLITGTGVGKHTEDRVPLIIVRRAARSTTYIWCLYLGPNGDRLALSKEDVKLPDGGGTDPDSVAALRVRTGSQTQVVLANPDARAVVVGGHELQSRIALLRPGADGLLQVTYETSRQAL